MGRLGYGNMESSQLNFNVVTELKHKSKISKRHKSTWQIKHTHIRLDNFIMTVGQVEAWTNNSMGNLTKSHETAPNSRLKRLHKH